MGRFRITISMIMCVVVLAAVAFAASSNGPGPELFIAGLILGNLGVLGSLQAAILGILYRRGPARAFWIGYALFGWPVFLWVLVLYHYDGPPDGIVLYLLAGVVPFGWLGGTIAKQFALPYDEPKATNR